MVKILTYQNCTLSKCQLSDFLAALIKTGSFKQNM